MVSWARKPSSVEEDAKQWARRRAWPQIWRLALSLPLPQAAAVAAHLDRRRWSPPTQADATLAGVLADLDQREARQLGATLFERTARPLPGHSVSYVTVGFAVHDPVAAVAVHPSHNWHLTRVVVFDRAGVRSILHEGPAMHYAVCALDGDTALGLRLFANERDAELVRYTPGSEEVLIDGNLLPGAQVVPTATGFVTGLALAPLALASSDGEQIELDLREFGLASAGKVAVDATGTQVVFTGHDRMLITDDRLVPLHHLVLPPSARTTVGAVTFADEGVITAGDDGHLTRWQVTGGRLRQGFTGGRAGRRHDRLDPVLAWGLLVGDSGNVKSHYDLGSLEPGAGPDFLVPAPASGSQDLGPLSAVGGFRCAPYAKLALYQGGLAKPTLTSSETFNGPVVHDLEHPFNILAKPLALLGPADADRVRPFLEAPAGAEPYALTDGERDVLAAAVAACEAAGQR